jgi:hypothetical protein
LTCVAISHSSGAATQKWIDLLGGAWNVRVVTDEDRSVYAAWGLGAGSFWYVLNPTTQAAGWREKGWMGTTVATALQRRTGRLLVQDIETSSADAAASGGSSAAAAAPAVMGNKWQEAGAWAVNERGRVVWGDKLKTADEVMDLSEGVAALGLR